MSIDPETVQLGSLADLRRMSSGQLFTRLVACAHALAKAAAEEARPRQPRPCHRLLTELNGRLIQFFRRRKFRCP